MNTIIIICNGKSISTLDFNKLDNIDTFGINGSYLKWKEMNWIPTYQCFFEMGPWKWSWDDINNYLQEYKLKYKNIFIWEESKNKILLNEKIIPLKPIVPHTYNIDYGLYSNPIKLDANLIYSEYNDTIPDIIKKLKDIYTKYPDISRDSATNLLLNKETDIKNIKNPRFDTKWVLPTSFDDFVHHGSPSGQTAIILAYLMGYKKIILLGMDGNFKFKNNNYLDVKESHWFENYFNGNEYNMMDFCSKCTEESINNMQYNSFYNVSKAFTANRIPIDIVNCTVNSPYTMFRNSTLEEELNVLQV